MRTGRPRLTCDGFDTRRSRTSSGERSPGVAGGPCSRARGSFRPEFRVSRVTVQHALEACRRKARRRPSGPRLVLAAEPLRQRCGQLDTIEGQLEGGGNHVERRVARVRVRRAPPHVLKVHGVAPRAARSRGSTSPTESHSLWSRCGARPSSAGSLGRRRRTQAVLRVARGELGGARRRSAPASAEPTDAALLADYRRLSRCSCAGGSQRAPVGRADAAQRTRVRGTPNRVRGRAPGRRAVLDALGASPGGGWLTVTGAPDVTDTSRPADGAP